VVQKRVGAALEQALAQPGAVPAAVGGQVRHKHGLSFAVPLGNVTGPERSGAPTVGVESDR